MTSFNILLPAANVLAWGSSERLAPDEPGVYSEHMKTSLRELLSGIIDYAGLFPPAALPMSEAATAYAACRRGPHAWLLSRFVCPAARFQELYDSVFADGAVTVGDAGPWRLAVLGRGGVTTAEFRDHFHEDLDLCRTFVERCTGRAVVDTFEIRWPGKTARDSTADPNMLLAEITELLARRERSAAGVPAIFFEVPLNAEAEDSIGSLIGTVARFNAAHGTSFKLKIRTGGVEASAVPDVPLVARFIAACAAHRVAFKATAGLHHPLRRYCAAVRGMMHGFFNVFVGAVLARECAMSEELLRELLGDDRADSFHFRDDGLAWRDWSADVPAVRRARADFAVGFGSCSLMEPVSDLTDLGLYRA